MKVVVANDFAAIERTKAILKHLEDRGIEYTFVGTLDGVKNDYPDMAKKAVDEYRKGGYDFGILICWTGIGMTLAANKMDGIRCAYAIDQFTAFKTRDHNDSNFIAFGEKVNYPEPFLDTLDTFLDTPFSHVEDHARRVEKVNALVGK